MLEVRDDDAWLWDSIIEVNPDTLQRLQKEVVTVLLLCIDEAEGDVTYAAKVSNSSDLKEGYIEPVSLVCVVKTEDL